MAGVVLKNIFMVILWCLCGRCFCFDNSTIDDDPVALKKVSGIFNDYFVR